MTAPTTAAPRGATQDGVARTAFRTCPLCEATCGLELTLHGERVVRVRGDREDVLSGGFLCPKGVAIGELHDDPDRLRTPLIREGEHFREASWEEAYARVAEGLAPYLATPERDAIAVYVGNPTVHNLGASLLLRPFLKALRTRNLYTAASVDQIPRNLTCGLLFGDPAALPVPDIDRTDYLLMLGANPWESNGSLWTAPDLPGRLKRLRKRGGRFVVVDPRRTRSAAHADEHLAIRPGCDALWLLALAAVIVSEGIARPGRLAELSAGLETLPALLAPFTPEAVATHCDIDAATTRRIARELAGAASAAVYARIGTHASRFGTLAAWATDLLNILTGNLDRAGGVMFPRAPHDRAHPATPGGRGFTTGRWHSRVGGHPEVMGEFPVAALAAELETAGPGQPRALITIAGNPVLSTPDGRGLDRALAGLDFMLSVDIYLNETSRHADVILPPRSPLERAHYDYFFLRFAVRSTARYSAAVLPNDAPDDADILLELARIVGRDTADIDAAALGERVIRDHVEREVANPASPIAGCEVAEIIAALDGDTVCDRIVDFLVRSGPFGDGFARDVDGLSLKKLREHPHGIDFGPMQPCLPGLLRTQSGRIDVVTPIIESECQRAAAVLAEAPGEGLVLIGRREFHSNNSWMHNLATLIERREQCTLRMHPADAAERGLHTGQAVTLRSATGSIEVPLEIHTEMRRGVVSLPHGYGHDRPGVRLARAGRHAGASANDVVSATIDPPSGNAILNGVAVVVAAAG